MSEETRGAKPRLRSFRVTLWVEVEGDFLPDDSSYARAVNEFMGSYVDVRDYSVDAEED